MMILHHSPNPELSIERRSYDYLIKCRICGKRLHIAERRDISGSHPYWRLRPSTEILLRAHVRGCVKKAEALMKEQQ